MKNNKNEKIITGNYYNKYKAKNPLVKFVMRKYENRLFSFIENIKINSLIDLGCGEGEIIKKITKKIKIKKITACDIDKKLLNDIKKSNPEIETKTIYLDKKQNISGEFDLAIFLEVLEHIEKYEIALKNIAKINAKNLIISIPNEPFFRLSNLSRLKYVKRLGNTPGHVNNFTIFKFKKLIKQYFPNAQIKFKMCYIWNFAYIKIK